MSTIARKICLVGDFGAGKTSLISRFVDRQFSDQYLSTVGVKMSRKMVEFAPDQSIQLLIWDIEGSTKFKSVAPSYLQGAKGAIVVGDVTRPETIENIPGHIESFTKINPQGVLVVALNKSDLVDTERLEQLLGYVQDYPACVLNLFPTSAKSGDNVDQLFRTLTHGMGASQLE
jgi:small GTP-binding protein